MGSEVPSALLEQRLSADETARLVPGHAEAEAGLQGRVVRRYVVAPVSISFLDPKAIHSVIARKAQPKRFAGGCEGVEDVDGIVGRHEKLGSKFSHVTNAGWGDRRCADSNRLAVCDGKSQVRQ